MTATLHFVFSDALSGLLLDSMEKQSAVQVPRAIWFDVPLALQTALKQPNSHAPAFAVPPESSPPRGTEFVATTALLGAVGKALKKAADVCAASAEALHLPAEQQAMTADPDTSTKAFHAVDDREDAQSGVGCRPSSAPSSIQAWVHDSQVDVQLQALLSALESEASELRCLATLLIAQE